MVDYTLIERNKEVAPIETLSSRRSDQNPCPQIVPTFFWKKLIYVVFVLENLRFSKPNKTLTWVWSGFGRFGWWQTIPLSKDIRRLRLLRHSAREHLIKIHFHKFVPTFFWKTWVHVVFVLENLRFSKSNKTLKMSMIKVRRGLDDGRLYSYRKR